MLLLSLYLSLSLSLFLSLSDRQATSGQLSELKKSKSMHNRQGGEPQREKKSAIFCVYPCLFNLRERRILESQIVIRKIYYNSESVKEPRQCLCNDHVRVSSSFGPAFSALQQFPLASITALQLCCRALKAGPWDLLVCKSRPAGIGDSYMVFCGHYLYSLTDSESYYNKLFQVNSFFFPKMIVFSKIFLDSLNLCTSKNEAVIEIKFVRMNYARITSTYSYRNLG